MDFRILIAILIFAILFTAVIYFFSDGLFQENGDIKQFGVFLRRETLFSMMPIVILLCVISFYIAYLFF
jgi:hypothetical protein